MELTHIDLFSGIGGFALAAQWAGFRTEVFCEIEPFCQEVLKKHWPEVPIWDDVKTFKWNGKRPTLLTGGFPCQPFSHAGKRRGKDDDRHLWPEMLRVISEAKPAWVVGENVAGIISMELEQVCIDLEAEGYEVQPLVIPACAVNAPHRRDRVWIIAQNTIDSRSGIGEQKEPWSQRNKRDAIPGDEKRVYKQTVKDWGIPWPEVATSLCSLDARLSNGLVGPQGWRVNALKAAGNSIVPQVAYQIIKGIAEIELSSHPRDGFA